MDVHRARFVPYPPSPITSLAFSHSTGASLRGQPLRLAIGRNNGDIELWDPKNGAWVHERTFHGGRERSVQGLVWISEPDEYEDRGESTKYRRVGRARLFSIGYSASVTEWDLCTGLPRQQASGGQGEVWCMAAQPRWRAKKDKDGKLIIDEKEYKGQDIAVGCADGTIALLSTADDGLVLKRTIARASKKNARALSMRFRDRDTVVVGFSDSTIRVYDIRGNGTLIRTMALGGGEKGKPKEKLVWAVECLKNGDVVSADSSGEVVFWDGKTYGQLQRLRGHEADALCLAASEDGTRVFSGGMDRRTCVYNCVGAGQKRRWMKLKHVRMHKHDVKAMASFDSQKKMSLVVSGGLDTQPVITPLREFGKEYHRALPVTPQHPPIVGAKRLLVSWWENKVTIWRIGRRRQENPDSEYLDIQPNYHTVAQMTLKGEENIASVSISPSGDLLAVSTSAEIKLFHLTPQVAGATSALKIQKLDVPSTMAKSGARLVQFSQDSKWLLFLRHDNTLHLARLTSSSEDSTPVILKTTVELDRPLHQRLTKEGYPYQNCLNGDWGNYDATISRVAFSSDSRILAVTDLGGNIDTFLLEGNEDLAAPDVDVVTASSTSSHAGAADDSDDDEEDTTTIYYGQHWVPNPSPQTLPRLPSHALVFSFRSTPSSSPHHQALINGNPGIHPTRHNPHAHSNAPPTSATTDAHLFIVTALHQILEYDVLTSRLTDWSRRNNDASNLPEEFKLQRERAVGCFWDVDAAKGYKRVWVYGASWIAVFDLGQDLPGNGRVGEQTHARLVEQQKQSVEQQLQLQINGTIASSASSSSSDDNDNEPNSQPVKQSLESRITLPQSTSTRKRKFSSSLDPALAASEALSTKHALSLTKNLTAARSVLSGAGSKILKGAEKDSAGIREAKLRKYDKKGREIVSDLSASAIARDTVQANEDEDGVEGEGAGEDDNDMDIDPEETQVSVHVEASKQDGNASVNENKAFHMITRYRPILGVIPLTKQDGWEETAAHEYEASDVSLEVAVVERPGWELDLGERFVGKNEKDL